MSRYTGFLVRTQVFSSSIPAAAVRFERDRFRRSVPAVRFLHYLDRSLIELGRGLRHLQIQTSSIAQHLELQLIWFEDSGHWPQFEESQKYRDTLVRRVLAETLGGQNP